jgi:predicted phosphate transport protein (TIGR00153 family)
MTWVANLFKPKQDNFMRYLLQQAVLGVDGLEGLTAYMKDPLPEHAERVNKAEKEADEVRRLLIDDLNRTFVTPLDREDIYTLSRAVDDLLDYAHTTVDEMGLLSVEPNEHLEKMANLLLDAAREIKQALERLEDHPGVANEHARRAKRAENEMERTYRTAIAELFSGPAEPASIVCMLKRREIYRHLSNAADRADEAANVISNIVVKTT